MSDSTLRPAFSWYQLSARTTAILLQVVLWVVLAGFYFAWNSRSNFHFKTPIWPLVLMQMGFAVLLFNSLVYLIIPRWLLRHRYLLALAGAVLLVVAYQLWTYASIQLIAAYLPPTSDLRAHLLTYYPEGPWHHLRSVGGLLNLAFDMLASTLFPIVISFLAYAFIVDRRRLALERDHFALELSYLKAQINPHFLFNTLGHLHTLTRTRDQRAGDVVLYLADLLRYTLYETDTERVLLSQELAFLDDYLALERLRFPQATITHAVTGTANVQQLAPLLLHPFYEQLFIGLEALSQPVSITSTLQIEADTLTVALSRDLGSHLLPPYRAGAAVLAAERRLALQYPTQHTVRLHETDGRLAVHLRIQL